MRPIVPLTGLLAAGAALAFASAAPAQVKPGSQQGLGLTGASIPPLLQQVRDDPYRAPAEPACETIPQELLALDKILGPDVDGGLKTKTGVGQMAAGYVRGLVPYRGVVRFLTGADGKDRKLQAAATAGYARRGFLRGLEAHLHCAPAAATQVADAGDKVAALKVAEVQPTPAPVAAPAPAIVRPTPVAARPALAEARPVSTHVTYQWVDSASGRTVVPDAGR